MTSQAGYGQPPPMYRSGGYQQQQYHMGNSNPAVPGPQGQGQQNDNPDEAAASESQHDEGVLKSGLKSVPENYLNVSTASILLLRGGFED